MRLDIPFFRTRTNSKTLSLGNIGKIDCFFHASSFQQVLERLLLLDEADLTFQLKMMLHGLDSLIGDSNQNEARTWRNGHDRCFAANALTRSTAMDKAILLAKILDDEAIQSGGGAAWIGAVPLPGERRTQLEVVGYDLYSGACGIAIFFGALSHLTGDKKYQNLAISALASLRKDLGATDSRQRLARSMGIGGCNGVGSVVYGLVLTAILLDEDSLMADALSASELITDELIAGDKTLDVMAGAAGAVLGLLALHNAVQDSTVLERATTCAQHLISQQTRTVTGHMAWRTISETPLTGFSHGAAGISYSLLRLYNTTREHDYMMAAREGIKYERAVFSRESRNWPDFREPYSAGGQPGFPCMWAHGATGIGLARLGALDVISDTQTLEEIEIALEAVINHPKSPFDALSFGNFGGIELLYSAGIRFDQPDLVGLAQRRAVELVNRHDVEDSFRWPAGIDGQNPGFFAGIAGIGYQLLRMIYSEPCPSVLLWKS